MEFDELLSALDYSPDDLICILERQENKDGLKRLGFVKVSEAQAFVSGLSGDIYYSVNPLDPEKVAQLEPGQRGDSRAVASLTTLYADLDSKESGLGSEERCQEFIDKLSEVLGVEPVAVVHTGTGGKHPYWKLDQPITASMLRAWGVLVKKLAVEFGGRVDSVFDAARVLRVPGIVRPSGQLVRLELGQRGIVQASSLTSLVAEYLQAEEHTTGSEFVPVETWPTADRTCSYVEQMVNGWLDDEPGDRHHWLLSQVTRLVASARLGCITLEDFETAKSALIERYAVLLNRPGSERDLSPNEIGDIFKRAKQRVETSSEAELKINELGNHAHPEAEVNQEAEDSWQLLDLTGYIDGSIKQELPKYWSRTDGVLLLYAGKTHSIIGESESGKSMLMQAESANILAAGGSVLYLDYEDTPNNVVERLQKMGVTPEQFKRFGYAAPESWHDTSDRTRELFERLLDRQWDLVVIDGVTEALNQLPAALAREVGSTGGNSGIAKWNSAFPKKVAEKTGAAVAMIDHPAKNSKGRDAIGGQHKMAAISGASYVVEPVSQIGRDLVGELVIKVGKDRPGSIRKHAVDYDPTTRLAIIANVQVDGTGGTITVTIDPPVSKLDIKADVAQAKDAELKSRITHWLIAQSEPRTSSAIVEAVGGNKSKVLAILKELQDEYITMEKVGKSNMHTCVKTYGADPDHGYAVTP